MKEEMDKQAKEFSADELRVGLSAVFERDVTEEDITAFARNSGDFNPLHTDIAYARATNFESRIVHGAFQVALASAMLGMHLPGRHVLLSSVNARFSAPLFFPCRVRVRGEITTWNRQSLVGSLKTVVIETGNEVPVSEISMGFTFHQKRTSREPPPLPAKAQTSSKESKLILVTGATGGIGKAIVSALQRENYGLLCIVNRGPLDADLKAGGKIKEVKIDLSATGLEDAIVAAVGDQKLFGVVHAAWPGAPHGGLLESENDVIERQIAFGTTQLVRIARVLFSLIGPEGGRFLALGSIYGTQNPVINLAAYSLGKAAMEHTVRLLAPELARKNIAINAICPSFLSVGLNKHTSLQQQKLEIARVPLQRLCTTDDVVALVRYLLASESAFISGQCIGLTGGQL